jgi:hypothetical protein
MESKRDEERLLTEILTTITMHLLAASCGLNKVLRRLFTRSSTGPSVAVAQIAFAHLQSGQLFVTTVGKFRDSLSTQVSCRVGQQVPAPIAPATRLHPPAAYGSP